jgi:IS30 family transposase
VHQVEDWAEVHRLFYREGMAKAAIARRLSMSRNTVDRLLGRTEPPRYRRAPAGSQVDPFAERIAAMLAEDPTVRATVIRERLRPAESRKSRLPDARCASHPASGAGGPRHAVAGRRCE